MIKKAIANGLMATAYIFVIVSIMTFGEKLFSNQPDTFLTPVLFISIFTMSAAIMGYLFCFDPIVLLISGKKKQAVNYFLQTTGTFALITLTILILVFSRIF